MNQVAFCEAAHREAAMLGLTIEVQFSDSTLPIVMVNKTQIKELPLALVLVAPGWRPMGAILYDCSEDQARKLADKINRVLGIPARGTPARKTYMQLHSL